MTSQDQSQLTPEIAQQWANALRSGKHKQTTAALQNKFGFCCLGVACDLFVPSDKLMKDIFGHMSGGYPYSQRNAPEWLKDINEVTFNKLGIRLSKLNDDGYSFDEIADLIELVYVHGALD